MGGYRVQGLFPFILIFKAFKRAAAAFKYYPKLYLNATVPGLYFCGFFTLPISGADFVFVPILIVSGLFPFILIFKAPKRTAAAFKCYPKIYTTPSLNILSRNVIDIS